MIIDKTRQCCENCKYAKISAVVKPPFLARIMDGKPDGELKPWSVTVECEHSHVCKDYLEDEE